MATKYAFRRAAAVIFELNEPSYFAGKQLSSSRPEQRQLLSSAPPDVRREVEQKELEMRATELMSMPEEVLQGMAVSALLKWLKERRVLRRRYQ